MAAESLSFRFTPLGASAPSKGAPASIQYAPLLALTAAKPAAYGFQSVGIGGLLVDTGSQLTVLRKRNAGPLKLGKPISWRHVRWKGEKHLVNIYGLRVEIASPDSKRYAVWDTQVGFADIPYPVEGVLGLTDFLNVFDMTISNQQRRFKLTPNDNFVAANGAVRSQPEFTLG